MRDGWTKRPSDIDKLAPALVKAQGQIEGASKDKKNDHFRSRYADLGAVWDACREALQANDIAVLQLPTQAPAGHIGLLTVLLHSSGQSISEKFFMPLKDASNPQAAGSALTYARRYALSAAIGICPVDVDGNAAAAKKPNTPTPMAPEQVDVKAQSEMARKLFAGAKTKEGKKVIFVDVRNGPIPEPEKTTLLTEMSNVLKGMK